MIDYPSIKIGYTNGKDFTLTGTEYTGYYHVLDGITYATRDLNDNTRVLTSRNTFKADLIQSNLLLDRLLTDVGNLALPYDFIHDIQIPPNETCTGLVINDRLSKLYDNTLYIYSKCLLASNDIPHNYDFAGGVYNGNLKWLPQDTGDITTFSPFSAANIATVGNSIQLQTIRMSDKMGYSYVGITPTHIIALSSDRDFNSLGVTSVNPFVDNNSDLKFLQLSSFCVAGDYMYVCDSLQNNIYKYDTSGFYKNDVSIANRRFLINSIGGEGNALAKTKFNSPDLIFANNEIDRVYVHDKGNRCIKIYDTNFTYVATRPFVVGTQTIARAFAYNEVYKRVYVLKESFVTKQVTLEICDRDLNVEETYVIEDVLIPGEYFKGIQFSYNNSNIFYMFTNVNVFKKFVNRPNKTIGKWLFYKSGFVIRHIWNVERSRYNRAEWVWNEDGTWVRTAITVNSFTILPRDSDVDSDADDIFLFAGFLNESFNKIMHYSEPTLFTPILGSTDKTVYSFKNLKVKDKELIQAFVLNKEISKVISDLMFVKNYLLGRYAASYDYIGNLVNDGFTPLTDDEFNTVVVSNTEDLFVHDNEIASSPGTLNRVFEQLYNIQNTVLELTKTRVTNFVPSISGSQTILLN